MTDVAELLKDKSRWESGFQTRDGRPARVLCIDLKSQGAPVLAAVKFNDGREEVYSYAEDGTWYVGSGTHDLIPRPVRRRKWINIYKNQEHYSTLFDSKEDADGRNGMDRIACIEIEFTEGEGLND